MMTFLALRKSPSVFRCFTGLTLTAFDELLPAFEQAYEAALDKQDRQRTSKRQRARGGGRRGALKSVEDKLVFILFYFKVYPIQELQGYLFGMAQTQAWDWIHRLTPLLHQALGHAKQLPARTTRDLAAVLQQCPGLEFIIDGTERPIRRPQDAAKQVKAYSGKKKRHTVKNVVITEKPTKKIIILSDTCEGKKHDKKLAEEEAFTLPPGSKLWQDTGFQGYALPDVTTYQPTKKPKGKELTDTQKANNKAISQERIGVEHSIGGIKVFGIVHQTYRNVREGFDDLVMAIACGLHNLRLDHPLAA